jgi:hypothetical protein
VPSVRLVVKDGWPFFSKIWPNIKNNAVNLSTNMRKMWQRFFSFLVVCLLMFYGEIFAQEKQQITHNLSFRKGGMKNYDCWGSSGWKPGWSSVDAKQPPTYFTIKPLPVSFYSDHLGIICRKELQLDKITPMPFRFRLGSLDYVNWMERKPNAIKPGSY